MICKVLKKAITSESARAGLAAWVNKGKITSGTEADGQYQICVNMHNVIFNWALSKY